MELLVHTRELRKQIQTTKFSNLIGLKENFQTHTHNPILLNIKNNDPF